MRFAFTGPTDIEREDVLYVEDVIQQIPRDDEHVFTTGAAFGVDTAAYFSASFHHENSWHIVVYPAGEWFNASLAMNASADPKSEVVGAFGGYMARNDELVAGCDVLIAFPPSHEEELRSGTWATVRRATKAEKQVVLLPLVLAPDVSTDRWREILDL